VLNSAAGTTYIEDMTHSPLLRAALIVSVVASLSLKASAQDGDAAFAAALGNAPSFAVPAQFKAKPQAPAAAKPKAPAANDAVWQKVLETVKKDGKYTAENGLMPGSFAIEDSTGDPKAAHVEQGITFLGTLNDDEQFEAMGAMLMIQSFTLDPKDGNWHIDQWMFETDVYGQVQDAGHGTVITAPDGKKISAVPEKLNPADPKIQAQYDAMLKHWAERKS
jgi:hypothetical protein